MKKKPQSIDTKEFAESIEIEVDSVERAFRNCWAGHHYSVQQLSIDDEEYEARRVLVREQTEEAHIDTEGGAG